MPKFDQDAFNEYDRDEHGTPYATPEHPDYLTQAQHDQFLVDLKKWNDSDNPIDNYVGKMAAEALSSGVASGAYVIVSEDDPRFKKSTIADFDPADPYSWGNTRPVDAGAQGS